MVDNSRKRRGSDVYALGCVRPEVGGGALGVDYGLGMGCWKVQGAWPRAWMRVWCGSKDGGVLLKGVCGALDSARFKGKDELTAWPWEKAHDQGKGVQGTWLA